MNAAVRNTWHMSAAARKPGSSHGTKYRITAVRKLSSAEIEKLTREAKKVIPERTAFYAKQMGVSYNRITIRHQKTRWGSCSELRNLNFNCLLMLAPADVLDYVIIHELCHLKEMNHSASFWREVERVLPNYKKPQKWLKENGPALMARNP